MGQLLASTMPSEPPPPRRKEPPRREDSFGAPSSSFAHEFHIPPLKNPLPLIPSRRPPPLEPLASPRGVIDSSSRTATAKLNNNNTRTKALENALPLEDDGHDQSLPALGEGSGSGSGSTAGHVAAVGQDEAARKKQKIDFFQLPKPTTKPASSKPPSFESVPVLNELHEPPPSAGLFPPITPNRSHSTNQRQFISVHPQFQRQQQPRQPDLTESETHQNPPRGQRPGSGGKEAPAELELVPQEQEPKKKARRKCSRGRLKWTDEETQDLMRGVAMFGVGKWKKILVHPELSFHPDRSQVDLKDRWRTCRMNEEKFMERQAALDPNPDRSRNSDWRKQAELPPESVDSNLSKSSKISSPPESEPASSPTASSKRHSFEITTPSLYREQNMKLKKPGTTPSWTENEDADLTKGYLRYGFKWTAMTKDPEFCLSRRTGAQVRDRFRMKYPVIYQSSVPLPMLLLPLSDAQEGLSKSATRRDSSKDAEGGSSIAAARDFFAGSGELEIVMQEPEPLAPDEHGRMTYREQRVLPPLGPAASSNASKHLPPTARESHATREELNKFAGLNVQELPDPEEIADDESDEEGEGEEEREEQRQRQREQERRLRGDETRTSAPPPPQPPSMSTEGEEARHLRLPRILNEEGQQGRLRSGLQLPSFRSLDENNRNNNNKKMDESVIVSDDDDNDDNNITLPPLQWEEMANRPEFDLE